MDITILIINLHLRIFYDPGNFQIKDLRNQLSVLKQNIHIKELISSEQSLNLKMKEMPSPSQLSGHMQRIQLFQDNLKTFL